MKKAIFAIALFALSVNVCHAIPITVSFEVDFASGAPTNPVSGTIVYDASSVTGNINSLTSIALVIDGHTYTLGEIGFLSPLGQLQVIGGTDTGVASISAGHIDFTLVWVQSTLQPSSFNYATATPDSLFGPATTFTRFSVTESTVPEPTTLALLGIALAGLGFSSRRKA